MSDKMLTTTEVGKIMGVHFSTVGRWIDNGKLKGIITPRYLFGGSCKGVK